MSPARRWNAFKDRLWERFGGIVYKVGVDAGFDCPNRDGSKGWGGCAYCSQKGSLSPNQDPELAIAQQISRGADFVRRRYGAEKIIVYFQAFTNTYDRPEVLRARYASALGDPRVVGLSIATRPDCISAENIEVLKEFALKVPLFTVELGLQSAFQNRLDWVNRQESVEDYVSAMKLLREAGLAVVTHIILGFPGESRADMLESVQLAVDQGTHGIKLQMLHVIRGTKLAVMHERSPLELMSQSEYLDLVVELTARIPQRVEIHRITGETDDGSLVAPDWVRHKTQFFDLFERRLEDLDLWQGSKLGEPRPLYRRASPIKRRRAAQSPTGENSKLQQ
jgi:radical SAM protein (TIGR01212 family)